MLFRSSWSQHVTSWLDQADLNAYLIRYEDLHTEPVRHFARLVELAGLEYNSERLARALEMSRFERLQSQEDAVGFKERPTESGRFFRRGKTNGWRDELTPEQIEKIIAAHGQVMNRLGYKI